MDRRQFLRTASASLLASTPAGYALSQEVARPLASNVVHRRALGSLTQDDANIAAFRVAVTRMQALPSSDPRNWTRIAQVHANFCPHGNWFFLPWHRAYLISFESICQQLSGKSDFALPYWDWTAQRRLPAVLAQQTADGRPNPLFHPGRRSSVDLPDATVGPQLMTRIMAERDFEMFGSTRPNGQNSLAANWRRAPGRSTVLESTPHNGVHVALGGVMATMLSPLDPAFWMHHCNIDRIWDNWTRLGRRNSDDRLWVSYRFDGQFVLAEGQQSTRPFNVAVSDLLDPARLGYSYVAPGDRVVATAPANTAPKPPEQPQSPPAMAPPLQAAQNIRVPDQAATPRPPIQPNVQPSRPPSVQLHQHSPHPTQPEQSAHTAAQQDSSSRPQQTVPAIFAMQLIASVATPDPVRINAILRAPARIARTSPDSVQGHQKADEINSILRSGTAKPSGTIPGELKKSATPPPSGGMNSGAPPSDHNNQRVFAVIDGIRGQRAALRNL